MPLRGGYSISNGVALNRVGVHVGLDGSGVDDLLFRPLTFIARGTRLIEAGQRHDLGILYGPLVGGRGGKCHRLAVDLHGIGDPIRPRHKARVLGDRRMDLRMYGKQ